MFLQYLIICECYQAVKTETDRLAYAHKKPLPARRPKAVNVIYN